MEYKIIFEKFNRSKKNTKIITFVEYTCLQKTIIFQQ
jgi:hypothetical protein